MWEPRIIECASHLKKNENKQKNIAKKIQCTTSVQLLFEI